MRLRYLFVFLVIIGISTWNTWETFNQKINPTENLSVSFLDVGQGDSIYIRAPNGNDVLIDGGPSNQVITQLEKVIPPYDRDIEIVIATHPDKDHIAGLISVLEKYDVKKYISSEKKSGTSFDISLDKKISEEAGLEKIIAKRGQRYIIDNTHGVYIDILFPYNDTSTVSDTNAASIVVRLVYGNQSFLLTGDAPISTENFLNNQDGLLLGSSVLKLGHHGSKTSSSDLFLQNTHPQFVVVSAGKNNRYHHPSEEVIERVSHYHIPILSTIDLGTITFETNGSTLWKK